MVRDLKKIQVKREFRFESGDEKRRC